MTGSDVVEVVRDALFTFMKVGGPVMVIALVVGLMISLVQALTQIQEQTLIYVPKVVAMALGGLLAMSFMGQAMAGFMERIAARIATGG